MERKHHLPTGRVNALSVLAKDPVCGMSVDPATARHKAEHGGSTYHFCSAGCRDKFVAEPAQFLTASTGRRRRTPAPSGAIYTCPMHPQVRQAGPGNCPICGMTLEPETVTADSGPSPELIDMTRRFWIGLALAVPVVALAMGGHLTNLHMLLSPVVLNWIRARSGDAGRAVGRLAVFRAGMGVDQEPQSQYVHADRHGRGRLLGL